MAEQAAEQLRELRKVIEFALLAGVIPENYAFAVETGDEGNDWLGIMATFVIVDQVQRLCATPKGRGAWPFTLWPDAYLLPFPYPELLLHYRSDDYPARTAFRFDISRKQVYEVVWHPPLWTPGGVLDALNCLGPLLSSDNEPPYTDPVARIGGCDWPRVL